MPHGPVRPVGMRSMPESRLGVITGRRHALVEVAIPGKRYAVQVDADPTFSPLAGVNQVQEIRRRDHQSGWGAGSDAMGALRDLASDSLGMGVRR